MKKVLFVFAIAVASFTASAQTTKGGTQFGGGVRVGLPVGTFGDLYSFGIGAELQAEHFFSPTVSGTFTTGYTHFIGKDFGGIKLPSFGAIPILAGVRVYPSTSFFIGGKVGYSVFTGNASGGGFTYEPQVGYNGSKFQLGLGYNGISDDGTLGHIGLTGIFKFN